MKRFGNTARCIPQSNRVTMSGGLGKSHCPLKARRVSGSLQGSVISRHTLGASVQATPDSWPEATPPNHMPREPWPPQATPSRPSGASASLALSPAVDEGKAGRPGLPLNLSRAPGPHPPLFSCWGGCVELFGGLHILAARSCLGIMT